MRNIKEVFVFPKIWYRRSLARRLFLGEESVIHENTNENRENTPGSSSNLNENFDYKVNSNENKISKNQDLKRRNNFFNILKLIFYSFFLTS